MTYPEYLKLRKQNMQRLCDIAVKGVLQQRRPSTFADGKCAYRGEEGTKCAIGFLIPDELYTPHMEMKGIASIHFYDVRVNQDIADDNCIAALSDLQHAHDSSAKSTQRTLDWKDEEAKQEFVDMFTEAAKMVYISYELEWNHG